MDEVRKGYKLNTGNVIAKTIVQTGYDSLIMEKAAEIELKTILLNLDSSMEKHILDKHYYRKHSENVYYRLNRRY